MILADSVIKQDPQITFDPLPEDSQYQPASVDLRLGYETQVPGGEVGTMKDGDTLWLEPGEFLLAHTLEAVGVPGYLAAQVGGKSSLARKGLGVHVTAGFIDPGFQGQITLELTNHSTEPFPLRPGMLIAQITYMLMHGTPSALYGDPSLGSHYQGQTGVTEARA